MTFDVIIERHDTATIRIACDSREEVDDIVMLSDMDMLEYEREPWRVVAVEEVG